MCTGSVSSNYDDVLTISSENTSLSNPKISLFFAVVLKPVDKDKGHGAAII